MEVLHFKSEDILVNEELITEYDIQSDIDLINECFEPTYITVNIIDGIVYLKDLGIPGSEDVRYNIMLELYNIGVTKIHLLPYFKVESEHEATLTKQLESIYKCKMQKKTITINPIPSYT